MCEVVSAGILITSAISAAAAGAKHAAEAQQAKATAKFQNQSYSQTASIAMENYQRTIGSTQNRLQQETAASSQSAIQNQIAGRQSAATASVSAAESGVQGNSVALLMNDFARQEAMNNQTIYEDMLWQREQADEELRSARSGARGNIAAATPRRQRGPSGLGLGLSIASSAFSAADDHFAATESGWYKEK